MQSLPWRAPRAPSQRCVPILAAVPPGRSEIPAVGRSRAASRTAATAGDAPLAAPAVELQVKPLAITSIKLVVRSLPAIIGISILAAVAGMFLEVAIHCFKSVIEWTGAKHSASMLQNMLAGEGKWACAILRDMLIIRYLYARIRPDRSAEMQALPIKSLWGRGVWARISILFVVLRAAWWKVYPALPRYFDLLLTLPTVALEGRESEDAFERSTQLLKGNRKRLAQALAAVYAALVAFPLPIAVVGQMLAVFLVIKPVCHLLGVPPEVADRFLELPNPETAFPPGVEPSGAFSGEQIVVVIMATVGKFLMGGLASLGVVATLVVACARTYAPNPEHSTLTLISGLGFRV